MTALRSLLRRWFPYLEDSALFFLSMVPLFGLTAIGCVVLASQAEGAEGRWITVEATAYCGGPCELCETTGVTANGTATSDRPYGVAGSPNLRLGSIVYIPAGCGYLDGTRPTARAFVLDDRGGALRTEWRRSGITRLDLRYRTHWSAQQFGRKLICVFVAEAK